MTTSYFAKTAMSSGSGELMKSPVSEAMPREARWAMADCWAGSGEARVEARRRTASFVGVEVVVLLEWLLLLLGWVVRAERMAVPSSPAPMTRIEVGGRDMVSFFWETGGRKKR